MGFSMSTLLSTVTPDYTAVIFDIAPQIKIGMKPIKSQKSKFRDNNTSIGIDINSDTKYIVTLRWPYLSPTNSEFIMNMWVDPVKANGQLRSFVWTNPEDENDYVAKFNSDPELQLFPETSYQSIDQVKLLVEGNYVP